MDFGSNSGNIEDITEDNFELSALEIMKRKHSHKDGSEVQLNLLEQNDDLSSVVDSEKINQVEDKEYKAPEGFQGTLNYAADSGSGHKDHKSMVLASCNCGETLAANFKDENGEKKVDVIEYTQDGDSVELGGYSSSSKSSSASYSGKNQGNRATYQ